MLECFLKRACTQSLARAGTAVAACLAVLLLGGVLAGCGGSGTATPQGEVRGKVTLAGQPVSEGYVAFSSAQTGAGAGGTLNASGEFVLDGALPAGTYTVVVTPPPAGNPLTSPQPSQPAVSPIPEKYRSETTTDLKADVQAGQNTLSFDLQP